MRLVWKALAVFFGAGLVPVAPGTATSLVVIILHKLFLHRLEWPFFLLLCGALFFLGSAASFRYSAELGEKDPRKIVIDEACGQLIALFFVPPSWTFVLLSFFFFRLFDIIKPYPIKRLERLPGGWGIMIDDVVAALYALLLLHFLLLFLGK